MPAHGLNKLAGDIIVVRENKTIIEITKDVAKFILNHTKFLTKFRAQQQGAR